MWGCVVPSLFSLGDVRGVDSERGINQVFKSVLSFFFGVLWNALSRKDSLADGELLGVRKYRKSLRRESESGVVSRSRFGGRAVLLVLSSVR